MSARLVFAIHAATDTGRVRDLNEDSYFAGRTIFAVADGMGGHQAGEVASQKALEPIAALDGVSFDRVEAAQEALIGAVVGANTAVVAQGAADPALSGMGTTLTAAIVRDDRLLLAHVGDSRAYLLREGERISQLTTDHTLVEQLVREGRLSREQAAVHPQRSVITRAIGVERQVEVDTLPPIDLQPGDQILLCSDGLSGPLGDTRIAQILRDAPDGHSACQHLVQAANDAGGPDNITVVLVQVEASGAAPWREPAGAGIAGAEEPTQPLRPASASGGSPAAAEAVGQPGSAGDGQSTDRVRGTADTEPGGAAAHPGGTVDTGSSGGVAPDPAAPHPPSPERTTQIRTRDESPTDWAERMGRYGDARGAGGSRLSFRRGRRLMAVLVAVLVLLGVAAGGGYLLLSRAYFVSERDGHVTIFNGVPQSVAGINLHWVREEPQPPLPIDDLPPFRVEQLRQGVTAVDLLQAREVVERYRELAEERPEADDVDDPENGPGEATPDNEARGSMDPGLSTGDAGGETTRL